MLSEKIDEDVPPPPTEQSVVEAPLQEDELAVAPSPDDKNKVAEPQLPDDDWVGEAPDPPLDDEVTEKRGICKGIFTGFANKLQKILGTMLNSENWQLVLTLLPE